MTNEEKEKARAVAAGGAGAGVGGAGAATIGVLELAAQGLATNLLAGVVVGAGAVFGALAGYGVYRLFRKTGSTGSESGASVPRAGKPDAPPNK
jgi:hypothetical protein